MSPSFLIYILLVFTLYNMSKDSDQNAPQSNFFQRDFSTITCYYQIVLCKMA